MTSAFLHYGVTHILFNMWALYVIGPPLESGAGPSCGSSRCTSSARSADRRAGLPAVAPRAPQTAGASGAIFGLFGATFVVGKRLNMDVRWVIGAIIAINLAFTFVIPLLSSQHISWQGHIGGLVTGAAVAAAYAYAPRKSRTAVQVGATVGVLLLFVLLIWWRTASLLSHVRRDLTGHGPTREVRPLLNLWSCVHVSVDM